MERIFTPIYERTKSVLEVFSTNVIRDAVTHSKHVERKMLAAMDVACVSKGQGRTLYGFGG